MLAGQEADGDADAVKAVLAVMASDPEFERAHVVAEMRDARYARTLRQAAGERVLTVRADDVIARAAAAVRGEVALGYRLDDATVMINPSKSASVTLGERDRIVVLGSYY